ncbi:MAG: class II aldolase/adducin family protein [Firmicutes bacterium]|nr:class II aldolase/adducin family protein [Bacillota bacterium]
MKMDICEAKEKVILAGKRLIETGLIARTWGNVSCRIDHNRFVITPSGRAYETLTPQEIVTVNINDGSYKGGIEPSSEKGVHAAAYSQRKDINFIIHTHQLNASALSPLGLDINVISSEALDLLGGNIISVPYGLPGTKALIRNFAAVLAAASDIKAFLLKAHGALCLGGDDNEAFKVALTTEKICYDYLVNRYLEVSGSSSFDPVEMSDYYVSRYGKPGFTTSSQVNIPLYDSVKEGNRIAFYRADGVTKASGKYNSEPIDAVRLCPDKPDLNNIAESNAAAIHREIYNKRNDLGAIVHTVLPDVLAISRAGRNIYPMVDDFAQIIGINSRIAFPDYTAAPEKVAGEILSKMKGRDAVIISGNGALCCGPNITDATAAVMIFEKNCRAVIASKYFELGKPIKPHECLLMRYIYLKRYSKKATSVK